MFEDKQGLLWVAAYPGINKFDPRTERIPIPSRPSKSQQLRQPFGVEHRRRSRGHLWFGTMDDGLDRSDPATETFTITATIAPVGKSAGSDA